MCSDLLHTSNDQNTSKIKSSDGYLSEGIMVSDEKISFNYSTTNLGVLVIQIDF